MFFSKSMLYFPAQSFDIYYQVETQEQAVQLIEQGDEIYRKLTEFYTVQLQERLRVYLLDGVDFSNAYADFFSNAIIIYINRSSVDYYDNSFKWWVPFVFSHELTHILIANKSDWVKDVLNIFGRPVSMLFDTAFTPSYFHEGVSIFSESLLSEKGRLNDDRYHTYLSAEIQDSFFKGLSLGGSMNSPSFTPTGYNYLYGAFFIKYIEEVYGSDTISHMVSDYGEKFRFNFIKLIEEISERKFTDFIHEWKNWLHKKTSSITYQEKGFLSENITNSGYYSGMNAGNQTALYYFQQKNGEESQLIMKSVSEEQKEVIGIPTDFDVSPSGKKAFIFANSDGLEKYDLSCFIENDEGNIRRIKEISRPKSVQWQTEEVVFFTYLQNGGTGLFSFNISTKERNDYLFPNADYFINNISIDGSKCFLSISFGGNSDIYQMDIENEKIKQITQTPQNEIDVYINGDVLYFSSNRESYITNDFCPYNIYSLNLSNDEITQITNTRWGAYSPICFDNEIYYRGYSGKGFDLYKVKKTVEESSYHDSSNRNCFKEPSFRIEENPVFTNLLENWNSERTLLPILRFGIPFIFPFEDQLTGAAGIAGWDDLKEWIWYGYLISFDDYKQWDYSLIHRGIPDTSISWNGNSDFETIKSTVQFPFYLRESEKYLLLRPGFEFGYFHTAQNLDFRAIANTSIYWSADYIGYPDNPVKVPEFYQLIQMGTSGFYTQTGIGIALPFSCTGIIKQKTSNNTLRLTAEGWYPFSNFTPVGTLDGKFKLSSFTFHLAENIDVNERLAVTPSTTFGIWVDLGVQYWLDMKLIFDFELDSNGIKPLISIQNSIL
jgi:hypothetical protein